jgi:hypothetical protein
MISRTTLQSKRRKNPVSGAARARRRKRIDGEVRAEILVQF